MSATNRGAPRVENDVYSTPAWVTRRLLEALRTHLGVNIAHASILEPCCGEGAIIRVLRADGARGAILGCDIRPECVPHAMAAGATQVITGQAQALAPRAGYELAITNPPFDQAADAKDTAGNVVAPGIINATLKNAVVCAFLLRSSFKLGAFAQNMPDEYKLPERPEFVASYRCKFITSNGNKVDGCGWAAKVPLAVRIAQCPDCKSTAMQRSTSDSSEYSWFVWSERNRDYGVTRMLPSTPLAERKALGLAA